MKHLDGDQLLSLYYEEAANDELIRHLSECAVCQAELRDIRRTLDEVSQLPVPERGDNYGSQVWRRLQPVLPPKRGGVYRFNWMWLGPSFAAVAVVAFLIGAFTQRYAASTAYSEQARTRVLLMAMSDHLERSQMILAELVNADPEHGHLASERTAARDLLAENRLLRESVGRTANPLQMSVLDQLERVLMDVANGPTQPSPKEVEDLQSRIKGDGLLLHLRVLDANVRQREQKL